MAKKDTEVSDALDKIISAYEDAVEPLSDAQTLKLLEELRDELKSRYDDLHDELEEEAEEDAEEEMSGESDE